MKRFFYLFFSILIIAGSIGFFLPANKVISNTANATIPFDGVSRVIVNKQLWKNWWPGTIINDSTVIFKDTRLHIDMLLLNGFKSKTTGSNINALLDLQTIATYNAETAITLNVTLQFSSNPFVKLYQYIFAGAEQKKYAELVTNLKTAFSDVGKIYGFPIQMGKVPNSSYVSVKKYLDHYPLTEEVYAAIDEIGNYILSENGKIMNDPIFNVFKEEDNKYLLMVALASNRDMPSKGKFLLKNMMLGNVVVAEVRGGPASIEKCREAVQYYVNDFRKISPAIAFERLVTNRLKEKDTTKWVTTVNYPVFQ